MRERRPHFHLLVCRRQACMRDSCLYGTRRLTDFYHITVKKLSCMYAWTKTWYSGIDRMEELNQRGGCDERAEAASNALSESSGLVSRMVSDRNQRVGCGRRGRPPCRPRNRVGCGCRGRPPCRPNNPASLGTGQGVSGCRDYRRAVEACQLNIDQSPSIESYVYLIYVYHALDGYLESLAKRDEWVKVGQLSLSMVNRGTMDLVDPPDMLARMAKEILHEGIRQQYDVAAGIANRLDKTRADELWLEVRAWEKIHPDNWWAGVPEQWKW